MRYFSAFLPEDDFTFARIHVCEGMKLQAFLERLERFTDMKFLDTKTGYHSLLNSKNGKKLTVMIDNVNLLGEGSDILKFLQTCTTEGYYFSP